MAELLSVPLKKPSEVDVVTPLKNLIQSTYSTADKPEDYTDTLNDFSKLRNNAIWRAFEKYESSLEVIYGYYDQLVALESKIPPQEVQIPFKWKDAFDKGSIFGGRISLTVASLAYEKVCVLFNIAALQSAVAGLQSVENDDSLKLAAKLLQQAAGIFNHLKSTIMLAIQQEPTPDLNPETLGALSALMLAQAQEIFVKKAIHDNMKDAIIAKLSGQCEDLYAECLKQFQKENLRQLWDKDWIPTVAGKQAAYHAISEFYQSLVCKANKSIGEEISRLEHSVELFKQAQQRSGKSNAYQELLNKATRNLNEAKKDNDFIYHERIPDIKSLDPPGKALLAKPLQLTHPLSQNFRDMFSELVPVAVHQAMAAYDVRKNEIVNTEIMKMRESTQLLNSILASLNLPAAIEITEGSTLPQSILDKADAVRQLGGITNLEAMIKELPELLKRNRDILDEAVRMLDEEKQSDVTLREQFKERWTRTPSDKLTEMFRSNAAKYRQIIENAVQADKVVREKFDTHRAGMELLCKPVDELQAAVPRSSSGPISDSSAADTLRQLMEQVEAIKAERDAIESELKSSTVDMKEKFLSALAKDGAISEPQLSVETLGHTFGPLQKQVRDSIARQEELVAKIQSANTQFVQETGAQAGGRENIMKQLAAAHDAFRELQNNLKEGTKFYNDLTQLLVVFQNKISDYCFARKTEKEELLKDLTQESSRQAPISTPSVPTHFTAPTSDTGDQSEGASSGSKDSQSPSWTSIGKAIVGHAIATVFYDKNVYKGAPTTASTPTPPSTSGQAQSTAQPGATGLPYPVYVQGMPVPYGATTNAPYPSYMPPPMPQGCNPFAGNVPYPANWQGYPGYQAYGQQGYPGQQGQQQQQGGYPHPQQGYQPPGSYQQPPPGGYQPPRQW